MLAKIQVSLKSDNNECFTWRPKKIFIISCSVLLRMRNVSNQIVVKINTHILCSVIFFFKNLAVYEMWKNQVEPAWPQTTIRVQHSACALHTTNAFHCNSGCTNAPPYYVIRTLSGLLNNIYVTSCVQKLTPLRGIRFNRRFSDSDWQRTTRAPRAPGFSIVGFIDAF
jgi:hypothetical protein